MDRRCERGGTLVEAAFALPLLLLFIIGILEFGRAYNVYQIATNAAREAARYAVAPYTGGNTLPQTTDIQNHALAFLNSGNVACSTDCVLVDTTATEPVNGLTVTYTKVTVTVPYQIIAAKYLGVNTSIRLTTSAKMRNETN